MQSRQSLPVGEHMTLFGQYEKGLPIGHPGRRRAPGPATRAVRAGLRRSADDLVGARLQGAGSRRPLPAGVARRDGHCPAVRPSRRRPQRRREGRPRRIRFRWCAGSKNWWGSRRRATAWTSPMAKYKSALEESGVHDPDDLIDKATGLAGQNVIPTLVAQRFVAIANLVKLLARKSPAKDAPDPVAAASSLTFLLLELGIDTEPVSCARFTTIRAPRCALSCSRPRAHGTSSCRRSKVSKNGRGHRYSGACPIITGLIPAFPCIRFAGPFAHRTGPVRFEDHLRPEGVP